MVYFFRIPTGQQFFGNQYHWFAFSISLLIDDFNFVLLKYSVVFPHADTLNGEMELTQSGEDVLPRNVSTAVALEPKLNIRAEDLAAIANATNIITHWFVDCQYVRGTKDMKLQHTFTEPNRTHHIEALIEASFEPVPTKPAPTLKSKLVSNWRTQHKADLPYICHNRSKTTPDPSKVYGHFEANVTVFGEKKTLLFRQNQPKPKIS